MFPIFTQCKEETLKSFLREEFWNESWSSLLILKNSWYTIFTSEKKSKFAGLLPEQRAIFTLSTY